MELKYPIRVILLEEEGKIVIPEEYREVVSSLPDNFPVRQSDCGSACIGEERFSVLCVCDMECDGGTLYELGEFKKVFVDREEYDCLYQEQFIDLI